MSDFDKKNFKINQTEKLLSSFTISWEKYYDSFNHILDEIRKANWRERNPILAVCGFVASVLIGLISIDRITMDELQLYLGIDGVVAFSVFIGYGVYNFVIMKSATKAEQDFIHIMGNFVGLKDHYLVLTYDIDEISLGKLEDFAVFVFLVEGSSKIRLYSTLNEWANSKLIPREIKKEVCRSISVWESGIKTTVASFEDIKHKLTTKDWEKYRIFIEDLIEYKNNKDIEKILKQNNSS